MTPLEQGFVILTIGMGVVFAFLLLLVFAMSVMSKIVGYLNTIWPEEQEKVATKVVRRDPDEENIAIAIASLAKKGFDVYTYTTNKEAIAVAFASLARKGSITAKGKAA